MDRKSIQRRLIAQCIIDWLVDGRMDDDIIQYYGTNMKFCGNMILKRQTIYNVTPIKKLVRNKLLKFILL